MNEDCRHFQSRTYETGEVARFCVLNLAPEEPWRCPDGCPRYERDIIDATFGQGSLLRPAVEEEPAVAASSDISRILEEADAIVTAAGPEIIREIEADRSNRRWWQVWKRRDDGKGFRLSSR
jgi:hypothetical protein